MKNKICSLALSFVLTASIISCSLRFAANSTESTKTHKVVIAPFWPSLIISIKYWFSLVEGTYKQMPKPE